ncbi:MAG: pyridoxamine 5'-phosphate oxidase family protein [Candidatus Omnitrophota bacterium]
MELSDQVISFLEKQGYLIVSTMDLKGRIHCSAKGIVGIEKSGKVFVIDLYLRKTFENLKNDDRVSVTAVNEHDFVGYTLQGRAKIVPRDQIKDHIMEEWENRIIQRMTKRVSRSVQTQAKSKGHFEAALPPHPQYLIEIDVENIIDLVPPAMRHQKS